MLKLTASCGVLACFLVASVQSVPASTPGAPGIAQSVLASAPGAPAVSNGQARRPDDWQSTLSEDTRHRLDVALQHLDDKSAAGQAFSNDTIMR
jgi:hypothetical protein